MDSLSSSVSERYLSAYGSARCSVIGEYIPDLPEHLMSIIGRQAISHGLSEIGTSIEKYASNQSTLKNQREIETYLGLYSQIYYELISGATEFESDSNGFWDADFRLALSEACADLGIQRSKITIRKI